MKRLKKKQHSETRRHNSSGCINPPPVSRQKRCSFCQRVLAQERLAILNRELCIFFFSCRLSLMGPVHRSEEIQKMNEDIQQLGRERFREDRTS